MTRLAETACSTFHAQSTVTESAANSGSEVVVMQGNTFQAHELAFRNQARYSAALAADV